MFTLLSEELDQDLPADVRENMDYHLSICTNCTTFKEQLHYLVSLCALQNDEQATMVAGNSLSEERKKNIVAKLVETFGGKAD